MKMFLAALLAAFSTAASATSATTDFSDLWYNRNESGWGANVIQQGDTLFVTLFVYNSGQAPTWFVASDVELVAVSGNTLTFSGILYQTTGPYFGAGSFNPAAVSAPPVGTLTFSASQISNATLTYVVNGVAVTKNVERQTWRTEDLSGSYLGGSTGTWSQCGAARNGYTESSATYTVTQDGGAIQMREEGSGYTCTYTGNYTAAGRMGTIVGNGLCSDGVNQAFTATEVEVSLQALTMRFTTNQIGGCAYVGRIGGMRRAP